MKAQYSIGQSVVYVTHHGYNPDMTCRNVSHAGTVVSVEGDEVTVKFGEFTRKLKASRLDPGAKS